MYYIKLSLGEKKFKSVKKLLNYILLKILLIKQVFTEICFYIKFKYVK